MDVTKINYEPWKIVRTLGQGSFGTVFEIEREEFGEKYRAALKVITIPQSEAEILTNRADGMDDASMTTYYNSVVQELTHEFALLSKLKGQTNIVGYEDHKVIPHEDGIGWDIYIRMELLTSLTKMSATYNFSREEVIKVGIDICKALSLCEKKGIIHRDIKPDNIFISENGDFELGDFGIARTASKSGTMYNMSRKGTPNYMAPEVYKSEPYNATVDIYSLGIVLYQLMNNKRLPFIPAQMTMSDRENALGRRLSGEPLPNPEQADAAFAKVILKACAYNPLERYATAEEMLQELKKLLDGKEPAAVGYDATIPMDSVPNNNFFYGTEMPEQHKSSFGNDSIYRNNTMYGTDIQNTGIPLENMSSRVSQEKERQENADMHSNQNNTTDKKPINTKMIMGIGGVVIAVLLIVIAVMALGGKKEPAVEPETKTESAENTTQETEEQEESEPEPQQSSVSVDSAALSDYMFELEGVTYKLPISYSDFVSTGWKLMEGTSEDDELAGSEYAIIRMTNGDEDIYVTIYNGSANTRVLKECNIGGIEISNDKKVDFKIAGGLNLESSIDDIKAYCGTPSDSYSGDEYDTLTYSTGEIYQSTKFTVYKEEKKYNSIALSYLVVTEGDVSEVSNEAPAYLSDYTAPTALAEDFIEPIFELDGSLYRLPCPLSEFIKNGWEISEKNADSIAAQNKEVSSIEIRKGDNSLYLDMVNFDRSAALIENCAVSGFMLYRGEGEYASSNDIDSKIIRLSGGVSLNSTIADVEKSSKKLDKEIYEYDNYTQTEFTYTNADYTKDICYRYRKSKDGNNSTSISISNESWDY